MCRGTLFFQTPNAVLGQIRQNCLTLGTKLGIDTLGYRHYIVGNKLGVWNMSINIRIGEVGVGGIVQAVRENEIETPHHIIVWYDYSQHDWCTEVHTSDCGYLELSAQWAATKAYATQRAQWSQAGIQNEQGIFCPIYKYARNEVPC